MVEESLQLQYIKGVGPKTAQLFSKLGVHTVTDFLYFFPRAHEDRRNLPLINQLKFNELSMIIATVRHIGQVEQKNRISVFKCLVSDASAQLVAIWFNQPYLAKVLTPGVQLLLKGKMERNEYTQEIQFIVSDTEVFQDKADEKMHTGHIVPVYSLVNGLYQYKVRKIARTILTDHMPTVTDPIPKSIRETLSLAPLQDAIRQLHFPADSNTLAQARYRIVFDEFFYYQLALARRRKEIKERPQALKLITDGDLTAKYLQQLPYTLTAAQQNAIEDIKQDVTSGLSMNRLIQGDVGCGKTDVAVMALLFAVQSGKKGVLMAPTQILAEQHYYKLQRYMKSLQVPVILLKGKMTKKEKRLALAALTEQSPSVVVGTHALVQEAVDIPNVGLVIVDEQHRFGVMQRMILRQKGANPHCLFMTATPIPRSLMLTSFGDLDKTIIREMPPGRIPPKTYFFRENNMAKVYEFCRRELEKNRQIYIVYPLVEESEKLDLKSAVEGWEHIKNNIFPAHNVGLLHGRMSAAEKADIMDRFKTNNIRILVATTVIEVGIDVPNASLMIIRHAERFGLSQLHQLRGRIGRGGTESFCFLIADPKNPNAERRIKAMLDSSDGFQLAEEDLRIRGPGDILGTRQAGLPEFNMADLIKDEKILLTAKKAAQAVVREDPVGTKPEYRLLYRNLSKRHDLLKEKRLN